MSLFEILIYVVLFFFLYLERLILVIYCHSEIIDNFESYSHRIRRTVYQPTAMSRTIQYNKFAEIKLTYITPRDGF